MRILAAGFLGLTAYAQVALEAPRFGCAVTSGRLVEYLGVEETLTSRSVSAEDVRQAVCAKNAVLVQRGRTVHANDDAVLETSGSVLLAAGETAAVLDIAAGRLYWLDSGVWRASPARVPEGAASLAAEGLSVWVLAGGMTHRLDLASGAARESRATPEFLVLAAVLPDGAVLGVRGRAVHRCSALECVPLYELPGEAVALRPLNGEWFVAALRGGAQAALSTRKYFLLPGEAE